MYLKLVLFNELAAKYPGKAALSMEMFETDCQNILNEYLEWFDPRKELYYRGPGMA